MADITETGPVGLKGLRGLNYQSPESTIDLQSYFDASYPMPSRQASQLQGAESMGEAYDVNTGLDLGSSTWDIPVYNEDQLSNAQDIRANNQWTIAKLGAGIGKGITTAATTFLDGTIGLVAGSLEALGSIGDENLTTYQKISKIWDNEFSNMLQEVNNQMENILPNYQTQQEQERAWYQNMGTANFWADFLKQIGFTVGAYYSGGAWNKGLKALGLLKNAGTAARLGAGLSAINEGRIEANNNSDDWEKLQISQLNDAYETALANQVADPEEVRESYNQALEDIKQKKAQMGLIDLGLNVPILLADNLLTFGKLYSRGFNTASDIASANKRKLTKQTISEGVEQAAREMADKEAGKQISKEAGKYVWNDLTWKDALKEGGKSFLREGNEEMAQGFASEFSGAIVSPDSPDAYYNALTDPKALQETKDFVTAITEGFMNSYGNLDKYQEFVMGGLTGLLGVPTFGKSQNSGASTYIGRNRAVGLSGGLFGAYTQNSHDNLIGQQNVQWINDYLDKYGKDFQKRVRHFAMSNNFTDAMNGWAEANNAFEYKNAEDNNDFAAIARFASVGKLQDYKDLVSQDFENISDEELEKIAQETIDKNTNKPVWANQDGSLMPSTDEGREQMRTALSKKRDNILEGISKYETYLEDMKRVTGFDYNENPDALNELAWLRWKIDRFASRRKELTKESVPMLNALNSGIESVKLSLQEGLNQLNRDRDTNKESEAQAKVYEDQLQELDSIQTVIDGWIQDSSVTGEEGTTIRRTLNDAGRALFLSSDFYDDYGASMGLTFDQYKTAISNLMDMDRLDRLAEDFNKKIRYYLDDRQSVKNKPKQKQVQKPQPQTDPQEQAQPNEVVTENTSDIPRPLTNADTSGEKDTLGKFLKTELKIEGDHAVRDSQIAQDNAIQEQSALRSTVQNTTTASQYHQLTKNYPKEEIDAIIKDIQAADPNSIVVQAKKIDQVLDIFADRINAMALPEEFVNDIFNYIASIGDQSSTLEEFANIQDNPAYGQALLDAVYGPREGMGRERGVSGLKFLSDDELVQQLTPIMQAFSDSSNSYNSQQTEAQSLVNNHQNDQNPSGEVATTGADEVTENKPINSPQSKSQETIPNSEVQNYIQKAKNSGIGDNQIIDNLAQANWPQQEAQKQLAIFNNQVVQTPAIVETEEGDTANYDETNDVAPLHTSPAEVQNQVVKTEELSATQKYNFISPLTTEYPREITVQERSGTFNYEKWVDSQKWPEAIKITTKVRHKYLSDAYKRVDLGEIHRGDQVRFVVLKEANTEVNKLLPEGQTDFIIFMADKHGNIIGDLGTLLNPESAKFAGQVELIKDIQKEYENAGAPDKFISSKTSSVAKIMVGRPQLTSTSSSVSQINSDFKIGIYNGTIIKTNDPNTEGTAFNNPVQMPLNPIRGQVYMLIPNGRKGTTGGYTAVLCTTPRFGNVGEDTLINKEVNRVLTNIVTAQTYGDIVKGIKDLGDYLWIPNIHIKAFNAKGRMSEQNNNGPIQRIVLSEKSNNQWQELITGGLKPTGTPNDIEVLKRVFLNTPFNINRKFLNTELGSKMYGEVVTTNVQQGAETTVNNWFTINPVIDGKEQKAISPKTTGINPTSRPASSTFVVMGDVTIDTKNYRVIQNNVELPLSTIDDPEHLNNIANHYLAQLYISDNPNVTTIENAKQTPYGWYDTSLGKLVNSPEREQIKTLKTLTREAPTETETGQQARPESDLDVLGVAEINGKQETVTLSELLEAQQCGIGTDIDTTGDIDIQEAAKAITEYRQSAYYKLAEDVASPIWDQEKELAWLSNVLPQLSNEDHLRIVEGLIKNKAWGMFAKGVIQISNIATKGTVYHEAFHAVTQTLLTDEERSTMYDAARERYKDAISILDLEENLAEDFRKYIELEETPYVGKVVKLFRILKNIINNLFNNQNALDKLFYDISNKEYVDRAQKQSNNTLYSINKQELIDKIQRSIDSQINRQGHPNNSVSKTKLGNIKDYWQSQGFEVITKYDIKFSKHRVLDVVQKYDTKNNPQYEAYAILPIEQYSNMKYLYSNLSQEQKLYLNSRNVSQKEYNKWSPAEKEQFFNCMGV